MQVGMISGHTRIIGRSQGYLGLPLRDVLENCAVNGCGTPAMQSAWFPTPAEIEAIKAGAPVILTVLGVNHPPVRLETGELPDENQ